MDGYLGEVKMFAGTYAPQNWVFCWGQMLAVNTYSSLYAVIGTQYGGDGVNTFGVPDLRGRIPVGAGTSPNLTPRMPGQMGGAENVTLVAAQLPEHTHIVQCDVESTEQVNTPVNNVPSLVSTGTGYGPGQANPTNMNAAMLSDAGSSQPHNNMPPWGCINYIMCVQGMWPPRS